MAENDDGNGRAKADPKSLGVVGYQLDEVLHALLCGGILQPR